MPGSTPRLALPYPLGTDPIASGDDMIAQLAAKLEALNIAWQMAAGTVNVQANGVASGTISGASGVVFPVGRFTVPPLVMVTFAAATSGSASGTVRASAITVNGFTVALANTHPSSAMTFAVTPVHWLAVQMTSAAAPG